MFEGYLRQHVSIGGLVGRYWILQNWWWFRVCWTAADFPFKSTLAFISRDISNVWETKCIEFSRTHSRRSLWGKWFPRTISPSSREDSKAVKWLLQQETGCLFSRQHLVTPPVSLLLLSLSFPLSSFARHQLYFSLKPQILQFSCNGLFFSPLLVEFPLERSGSSFSTRLNPQFHLCDARILSKSISLSSSSDHSSCRL